MRRSVSVRLLAAAAAVAAASVGGAVVSAAPATALSPCQSPTPPDWCYSPPAPPSTPTSLRATAVLQTSVSLTWSSPGNVGLTLTRTAGGTTATFPLSAGTTSFTDTAAPAGSQVTYRLWATACNRYGCTDGDAATLTVTTHPFGTDPIGSIYGGTQSYYGAPANPADNRYYYVGGWALDFDTTSPIQVQLYSDGTPIGALTASGASSTNSTYPGYGNNHAYSRTWLTKAPGKGTHQTCAVALNVGGGKDSFLGCYTYYVPGAPAAATNVKAVAGSTSVTVTFTDNADDEDGFYLQRSTDGGRNWLQVGGLNAPVPGVGRTAKVVDNSVVGPGVCYQVLEQNRYGQTVSAPGCTS